MELPGGGLAAWITNGQRAKAYNECTGYIIPTLFDYDEAPLAIRCADWLLTQQREDGAWEGYNVDTPQTFDTAAVVEGLNRTYQETGKQKYLDGVKRAKDWLFSMRYDGKLRTEPDKDTRVYTCRAAWIMGDYEAANYWYDLIKSDGIVGNERPHYVAYALEGLHNLHYDVSDILTRIPQGDIMPFYMDKWMPVGGTDTSATIQMAMLLYKNCMDYQRLMPGIERNIDHSGGLHHSDGEARMTLWTAKYYLDLMRLM